MNRIYPSRFLMLITLTFAVLLVGCNPNTSINRNIRTNIQFGQNGRISKHFTYFNGVEQGGLNLQNGQRITFDYEAALNKGNLAFKYLDPSGRVVWEKLLSGSTSGTDEIVCETSGRYTFIAQGQQTSGYFNFAWDIE